MEGAPLPKFTRIWIFLIVVFYNKYFVHRQSFWFSQARRFGKKIFPSSDVEQWSRITFSSGPNWVEPSSFTPDDVKWSSFRKTCDRKNPRQWPTCKIIIKLFRRILQHQYHLPAYLSLHIVNERICLDILASYWATMHSNREMNCHASALCKGQRPSL
jgi:hypothetical protein